jgi:hypothetical protein
MVTVVSTIAVTVIAAAMGITVTVVVAVQAVAVAIIWIAVTVVVRRTRSGADGEASDYTGCNSAAPPSWAAHHAHIGKPIVSS